MSKFDNSSVGHNFVLVSLRFLYKITAHKIKACMSSIVVDWSIFDQLQSNVRVAQLMFQNLIVELSSRGTKCKNDSLPNFTKILLIPAMLNPLVPKHRMICQKTFIFHPVSSFGKSNRKQGLNLC